VGSAAAQRGDFLVPWRDDVNLVDESWFLARSGGWLPGLASAAGGWRVRLLSGEL
jgi:hypothetical protein